MRLPIADLHCDLLSFLELGTREGTSDPKSRASYFLMKEGGVALQCLPIFTETKRGSSLSGKKQFSLFKNLLKQESTRYAAWNGSSLEKNDERIQVMIAVENASSLLEEDEPLSLLFPRLEDLHPAYISLTWNGENRFGGGCGSHSGLKPDGKTLLEYLSGKTVAIDVSHASDFLIDNIFNYIDKHSLKLPIIASHSNTRVITPHERNLSDLFIQEIIERKGLVGLNLFAPFLGKKPEDAIAHIMHILKKGGEDVACLGADFFFPSKELINKYKSQNLFFPSLANAGTYPYLLKLLSLPEKQLKKVAYENIISFYNQKTP